MARPEKIPLEVRLEAGVGRPEHVFRFRNKTIQVGGTFNARVQVEASISGDDYFVVGAPLNSPGAVSVAETVEFVRIRTLNYTSGEPTAVLAGFDERAT